MILEIVPASAMDQSIKTTATWWRDNRCVGLLVQTAASAQGLNSRKPVNPTGQDHVTRS